MECDQDEIFQYCGGSLKNPIFGGGHEKPINIGELP